MTPDADEYDVYLSCPMGSIQSSRKYQGIRSEAMTVLEAFERDCGFKTFFFGREVGTREFLEESDLPIVKIATCLNALRRSRAFVLLYPCKLASSALVESGFALSLNKKAIYFVRSREHLPFFLRHSESAFPVRIHQYKTVEGLVGVIRTHRARLFDLAGPDTGGGRVVRAGSSDDERRPAAAADACGIDRILLPDLGRVPADVSEEIRSLERLSQGDVPSILNKIRFITEKVLYNLCVRSETSWGQADPTVERMLGPLVARGVIPRNVAVHVRTIQINASPGSHYQESALTRRHAVIAQEALMEFLEWYAQQPASSQPGLLA
jgi:hypothetical protein